MSRQPRTKREIELIKLRDINRPWDRDLAQCSVSHPSPGCVRPQIQHPSPGVLTHADECSFHAKNPLSPSAWPRSPRMHAHTLLPQDVLVTKSPSHDRSSRKAHNTRPTTPPQHREVACASLSPLSPLEIVVGHTRLGLVVDSPATARPRRASDQRATSQTSCHERMICLAVL
jgi:hypothetical protein